MGTIHKYLSLYRNEIKGLAILWVVFFHAQLGLEGLMYQIQRIGYGGVDIFFFMSGFGLYHSLERDADLGRYLTRRTKRILPSYFPFCLCWLVVMIPLQKAGLTTSLRIIAGNLTMSGYFAETGLNINWYLGGMALSMLLAPFFFAFLRQGKRAWLRASCLIVVLLIIGIGYIGNERYIVISRLPVFVVGMLFAAEKKNQLSCKKYIVGLIAGAAVGFGMLYTCLLYFPELCIDYAMYWHPFVLIAPALCTGMGWLFSKMPRSVLRPFTNLGQASFEIFLFNVWIELLGKRYGMISSSKEWGIWSLLSIAAGLAYYHIIQLHIRRRKTTIHISL